MMDSDDLATRRKALAARLYRDVFGAGKVDAADVILAADIVSHGPGMPPRVGTDGIKLQAMVLRGAMPDLRVELRDQLADGDRVASRWFAYGTHTGPLRLPTGEVAPSGRAITFEEMRIDRFVGERITESWFIPDRMAMWQQLGLIPS